MKIIYYYLNLFLWKFILNLKNIIKLEPNYALLDRVKNIIENSPVNKYYIKGNNSSNNFIIILNSPNLKDASLLCVKYNSKQYLEYTNHSIYYKILYIIS